MIKIPIWGFICRAVAIAAPVAGVLEGVCVVLIHGFSISLLWLWLLKSLCNNALILFDRFRSKNTIFVFP